MSHTTAVPVKMRARRGQIVWHDPDGPCWRTRRTWERAADAERVARMFAANPLWRDAHVKRSHAGGLRRWCVHMYPADYTPMHRLLSDLARRRAAVQGPGFIVTPIEPGLRYRVYNPVSEREYVTSAGHCSCPQFTCRAQMVGARCKHIEALHRRGVLEVAA